MTLTRSSPRRWGAAHLSIDNLTAGWMAPQSAPGAYSWGTANRAIYVPVRVSRVCVVKEMGPVFNTASAANQFDIGLYDAAGTRLVSTGARNVQDFGGSAVSGADVTDTTLQPGLYYIGLNHSSATGDQLLMYGLAAPIPVALGVLTEALGSVTLPATATWTVDQTLAQVPVVAALIVTELG